jgi:nicotinamidase-related amidase
MFEYPQPDSTALILIDVQEKFIPAMLDIEKYIAKMRIMLEAAKEINLDTIITEQYPQGLGSTISSLLEIFKPEWPVITKNSFSCFGESEFNKSLAAQKRKSVIIMGIETHVCVQQTAFDALNKGYQVIIPADTVTSRNAYDRELSLKLMASQGAIVTSTESILFMLLKSSKHPAFRTVSKLIK